MVDQVIEEVRGLVQAAGARNAGALRINRGDVRRFSELCEWHKRVVFHDKGLCRAVGEVLKLVDGTFFCYHFKATSVECGWTASQQPSSSETQTERASAEEADN